MFRKKFVNASREPAAEGVADDGLANALRDREPD
jgi:hypothetical protein